MHSPQANLFFTRCSILGAGDGGGLNHFRDDNGYLIVNAQNSEFHGGILGGYVLSCYFTNCLVDRMLLAQVQGWPSNAFILTNCTFHGGQLTLTPDNTPIPIAVRDCAFDGAIITASSYGANSNYANYNYNAFTNTAGKFPIGGTHDKIVTGGFKWQTSWFGNFYLPNNSSLINAGDLTADKIGLYHFTTQTNQVPETNSVVDIGYHYVATDGNGNPLDTYWLGIPDYLADSNGALGAWEVCYFGHLGLDPNASDGQGNTFLYDYQNGLEPTNISFQISFTNQYVNLTNAPLSLAIQSGVPYYWAVLLDNTNFGGASWTAYTSSNITANLGTVQGWHTVWVGLSGRPAGSQAAWNAVRLDLDLTAPILTVTNALNVTIPMIQLQGYANEELAWITYDLNNANGSVSNQPGFMTGAIFDTNSFTYTNDAFKCFDLVLASGANTVTLHAADLAGNLTTSNFMFNLNYSNKPAPVVTLWWPQNGAQISGSSFTWRGTVDDPTVTLSAQITDTNGDVNVVAGVIERNGNFWVDNLPLAPGTNWLTLAATDINNHVTSTNIYVVQSSVGLSITANDAITTQTAIGVSGTIGTNGYLVWVNGVLASQSGRTWTAYNVPVNGDGVQVIQACAIPDTQADNYGYGTGSGGGGTNSSLSNPGNPSARDAVCAEYNPEKEPIIICVGYHQSWSVQDGITNNYWQSSETINWSQTNGGSIVSNYSLTYYSDWITSQTQSQWDSNGVGSTVITSTSFVNGVTNNPPPSTNAYDGPTSFGGLQGQTYGLDAGSGSPPATGGEKISSDYLLYVRGEEVPGWQRLLALSVNAQQVVDPWYPAMQESWDSYEGDPFYWAISSTPIPYSQQMMMGVPEDSDGHAFIVVPCGAVMNPQPHAGVAENNLSPIAINYKFVPQCQATIPTNQIRTNIGVGELVNLSFNPSVPTNTQWSTTAGSLMPTTGASSLFTAPSNAANVTITVTLPNDKQFGNGLNVLQPTGVDHAVMWNTNWTQIRAGAAGVDMVAMVFIAPTSVSLTKVCTWELGCNASNVTGYFAQTNLFTTNPAIFWGHVPATNIYPLGPSNFLLDELGIPNILPPPYQTGSFTWSISNQWKVGQNGTNNPLPQTQESFQIDSNGTVTIRKFGLTAIRYTNNFITNY